MMKYPPSLSMSRALRGQCLPALARSVAFTLPELLVVLVIIGLPASYVGSKYFAQLGKSEVTVAKLQIESFEKAPDTFSSMSAAIRRVKRACPL